MLEPVITTHDRLVDQLRSGHGAAARQAPHAARARVLAALDACVVRDPRPVPGAQSRSLYYARLYADLSAGLDGVRAHLFADDDWTDENPDRNGLALAVLGGLARRGRADAVDLLRRYAVEGRDWADALARLARAEVPGALDGLLPHVLDHDDDELVDCIRRTTAAGPWRRWAETEPRLRTLVERIDLDWWRWEMGRPRAARPATGTPARAAARTDLGVGVDEVLRDAAAAPRRSVLGARRLAGVAGPEHRAVLLSTAWCGPDGARAAALRYLGDQRDPAVLDLADQALDPGTAPAVRQAAAHAAAGLRTPAAVARARAWLAAGDDTRADVALRILAAAGDPADGPALVAALERDTAAAGDRHRIRELVAGIGRLGVAGGLTAVRDLYDATDCSGLRERAVTTLARIQPDFATSTAVDCLWDCQPGTRALAARHADLRVKAVRARLRVLAWDPAEEPEVREAARGRLAA
jgi:hypothetical protein